MREKLEGCFLLILIIAFIIAIIIFQQQWKKSQPKFKSYRDKEGFSFVYPTAWRKISSVEKSLIGAEDAKVILSSQETGGVISIKEEPAPNVKIYPELLKKEANSTVNFLQKSVLGFKKEDFYFTKDGRGFVLRFRGIDAERKSFQSELIAFYREGKRFGFLVISDPSSFKQDRKDMIKMIDSLTVFTP
jgi:DNA-binding transcriptional regulator of glucitol operon